MTSNYWLGFSDDANHNVDIKNKEIFIIAQFNEFELTTGEVDEFLWNSFWTVRYLASNTLLGFDADLDHVPDPRTFKKNFFTARRYA